MKIGTITFNGAHNNGALLQAYALQKYLEKIGHEVSVINYRLPEIAKSYRIVKHRKRNNILLNKAAYTWKYMNVVFKERYRFAKHDKFEYFINNKLNVTKEVKTLAELRDAKFDFDALISGSDQVWNYKLTKGLKPAFFLDFGKKDAKRISYAASMGVEEIDEEQVNIYERYLTNLDFISVREESAKKLLSPLTKKDIEVVLDPTLLLNAEDYDDICKEPEYKEKYIYFHHIAEDPVMIELAKKVSEQLGLRIVSNKNDKRFKNELDRVPSLDPNEFNGLIKNAEFVITNSFHATVFSILHKRKFFTVPHPKYPIRMVELLGKLDLNYALISKVDDNFNVNNYKYDYDKIFELLDEARKVSYDFLENALNPNNKSERLTYFDTKNKFTCYGCTACEKVCPKNAISMKADDEGFIYPVIDEAKCIKCGLCKKVCIYNNDKYFNDIDKQKTYAMQNKNVRVLQQSSSGGVFSAFADYVISKNGYVFGVELDKELKVTYNYYDNEDYEKFRGSKYVRTYIGDIYVKVKEILEAGKLVLFSGTPCIVAGLRSYLNKDYDNLYVVDIICHASCSPKVLSDYIKLLEERENSKITKINFRNKSTGWRNFVITFKFENKNVITESGYSNDYMANFLLNHMSRPSCYKCEYSYQYRTSDVSLGDYWGIDTDSPLNNNKGASIVLLNNEKGQKLFNEVKEDFEYYEAPKNKALRKNHRGPLALDTRRYQFFKKYTAGENIGDIFDEFNTRKRVNNMAFGSILPIFYKTRKNLGIFSLCMYKGRPFSFIINKVECPTKFLFKRGIPFIKGYKFNLYKANVPLSEIGNFNIQNKVLVSMSINDRSHVDQSVGYDLMNLRTGKNRNSKIFRLKNSNTVAYFRQSVKNAMYITVRDYHETDKRSNQIKIFFAKLCSYLFIKRDIILLYEKECSKYEESASVLYEKLIDLGYKNVYYILDKNYPYMNEIDNKYKKKLINRLSFKHYLYFFKCKKFISTESLGHAVDLRIANRYVISKLQSSNIKYVFLQHGVMYMVSLSSELRQKHNKDEVLFSKVVVSSQLEADHFVELGGYDPKNMYICGLAKYDRNIRYDDADKIVIMLTWRRWEFNSVRTDFENTKYYKFIKRIIDNIPNKYKDKIVVIPHPLFLKNVRGNKSPISKYMPEGDFKYDEILRNTKLLITDYSSISYDAFYRGSNVIFCWEERDECLAEYGESSKLMLNEDNSFGDICYDTKELKSLVEKNYNSKQRDEYVKKYRKIVEFNDGKNTERLIEMLKKDNMI